MKALLSKEVGGPETLVLEEVEAPSPGKGQVVIDVAACAINFPRRADHPRPVPDEAAPPFFAGQRGFRHHLRIG